MTPFALLETKHIPLVQIAKGCVPPFLWAFAYRHLVTRNIPDAERYGMVYRPWHEPASAMQYALIRNRTLISPEGCWQLAARLRQSLAVPGAIYEMGVYKGGSARLLRNELDDTGRTLRLFDTFVGMLSVNATDRYRPGDFANTSLDAVRAFVGSESWIDYRPGWIPDTFSGIEADRIAFAHIDLDLHDPTLHALQFVYPRLSPGGAIVLDDYGYTSTPGARRAIDAFFADKPEVPIILQTGQAILIRL